jgi:hypothetical protein
MKLTHWGRHAQTVCHQDCADRSAQLRLVSEIPPKARMKEKHRQGRAVSGIGLQQSNHTAE